MFSSLNNLSQKHCNIILKVLTNPNYQYYMFCSLNNLSQKHCNIILKVLTNPNYQYYMFCSLNNLSQKHCNIILKVLTNPRRYLTGAGILKAVSLYSDEGSQLVLKSVIEPLN